MGDAAPSVESKDPVEAATTPLVEAALSLDKAAMRCGGNWAGGRARCFDEAGATQEEQRESYPMPETMLLEVAAHLRPHELRRVQQVCVGWARLVTARQLLAPELRCFHSKVPYTEDVLGVGLAVERHRAGKLKSVTSPMDMLSYTSFRMERVRLGVWKQPFEHFLPLVLTPEHAARALPIMQGTLMTVAGYDGVAFRPLLALDVLASLMNSTVVSLMLKQEEGEKRLVHASERALQAYCAFHHLLLFLAARYPEIGQAANQRVQRFIEKPGHRTKAATPDLGHLMAGVLHLVGARLGEGALPRAT